MEDLIRKYALQNAVKFKGKASPGPVMGKIFAEDPELKKQSKELAEQVRNILQEVNALSPEEQMEALQSLAPELLEKKEHKERDIFAFLNCKEGCRTAFPPGPEKYPHIGHAKALLLNYMLAKQMKGKFILRFEDTNPNTAKSEYYEAMLDNFAWLGAEWDELIYASDFMDLFYEKGRQLLEQGHAYLDRASQEEVKRSREKGTATNDRDNSPEENLQLFEDMQSAEAGSMIMRLKIDLQHKNSTMRDPTIFRIIDEEHPRQGKKYRIWPTYDLQNAVMDSHSNIDMRLRSKEFELRAELQRWLQDKLNIPLTNTFEFGRFNMEGVLSSGRVIREKVESGELLGWDDPSLTTLVALKRRGFLPEAIKNFVLSTGISKNEATMTWDDLIMHNKRLLDQSANRYSAIFDPIELPIDGAPALDVELHVNPNEKKGGRKLHVAGKILLAKKDADNFQDGEEFRLMDCMNVAKAEGKLVFKSLSHAEFRGKKVINWLPAENNIEIEVLMPDREQKQGVAEHNISALKPGDIIQFERFGFCRLDSKNSFWFTHH